MDNHHQADLDITRPIEIATDVFWVGYNIPNDEFQCHTYLIRNGRESIWIDPGSMLTYQVTMDKIRTLLDPNDIKYFICNHQDPDIASCLTDVSCALDV
jgi:flavorubredoxin